MDKEKIYVFDAYGTLFDVDHACKEMAIQLGNKWNNLSSVWRQKQLEYSWLHNSMNSYVSFWNITEDSLEYSMNSLSINSVQIKKELLDLYYKIGAFEEVEEVLKKIKQNKIKTAILSNGSYDMLNSAVKNSKFDELISEVIHCGVPFEINSIQTINHKPTVIKVRKICNKVLGVVLVCNVFFLHFLHESILC